MHRVSIKAASAIGVLSNVRSMHLRSNGAVSNAPSAGSSPSVTGATMATTAALGAASDSVSAAETVADTDRRFSAAASKAAGAVRLQAELQLRQMTKHIEEMKVAAAKQAVADATALAAARAVTERTVNEAEAVQLAAEQQASEVGEQVATMRAAEACRVAAAVATAASRAASVPSAMKVGPRPSKPTSAKIKATAPGSSGAPASNKRQARASSAGTSDDLGSGSTTRGNVGTHPVSKAIDIIDGVVRQARTGPPRGRLIHQSLADRVAELLPGADAVATATLLNLPTDFLGFAQLLEPVLTDKVDKASSAGSRPGPISVRFADFVERERTIFHSAEGAEASFVLPDTAAVQFFTEQGARHGSRTVNHQCGRDECNDQSCCLTEHNMSSVQTYGEQLAAISQFADHAHVFRGKIFAKFLSDGAKRQQTDGRFQTPAPPILEHDAEVISAEGSAVVAQHRAAFGVATLDTAAATASFHACRDAQGHAMFLFDLATGRRAHDIASTQTKDVYIVGKAPTRELVVMHKTAKVLMPASVYSVREQADPVLQIVPPRGSRRMSRRVQRIRSLHRSGLESRTVTTTRRCAARIFSLSFRKIRSPGARS